MTLKRQLLIVSLLTLVLPWAGCQFVRQTETALRTGQQQMLAGTARAVAESLSQFPGILDRPAAAGLEGETIYAHALSRQPAIDGYFDDWPLEPDSFETLRIPDGTARFVIGLAGGWLYFLAEVEDGEIVHAAPASIALADGSRHADRVTVTTSSEAGTETFVFAAEAPGPLVTYVQSAFGFAPEPTILAWWQDVPGGYQVEARIPRRMIGERLGVAVVDTDDERVRGTRAATWSSPRPGRFVTLSPEIGRIASELVQPSMRMIVTDEHGWRIATAGDLPSRPSRQGGAVSSWLRLAYDALLKSDTAAVLAEPDPSGLERMPYIRSALDGRPDSGWFSSADGASGIVAVAEPIRIDGDVAGAVVLQQGTDAILSLTNESLARLLYVTLAATLAVAATLLGYATWLSRRIGRLSVAAERALDDRRLAAPLPSANAGDEIGDLSRSFSSVLRQLGEYNEYLQTLASKLSHELRTPLAIVTSSLDNLEHENLGETAAGYTSRARDGADRLRRILAAMSEARRVEELMENAELEVFDLRRALESTVEAYRDVYAERRFVFACEAAEARTRGAPELVIQMLDKLVDNAVDFSRAGDTVTIVLGASGEWLELSVENPGPPLPERMRSQLFDSMVSVRAGDDRHLGLGLYVAKLVADGHGGRITADNVDGGVRFTVRLPAAREMGSE